LRYRVTHQGGHVRSVTTKGDQYVTLNSGQGLSRAGWVFAGWSLNGHLPAVIDTYPLTGDVTLVSIWRRTVAVAFDLNGGTGIVPTQNVPVDTAVALNPGVGLTRTGYVFEGWSTSGDLPALGRSLFVRHTTRLRAIWRQLH
jgi:hypothetical protein